MAFHDLRFPTAISFGSSGGPERRTEVVALASGHEERNSPWAHGRRRWDAGLGLRSLDDVHAVLDFFEARRGRLHGFRFRDWTDWKSCAPVATPAATDQPLGTGDGTVAVFQLVRTYGSAPYTYTRLIHRPVDGTVTVAVDGTPVPATADPLTGLVTLAAAPPAGAAVTAGYEFDVPARFDTDMLTISLAAFDAGEIPSIPVIELLG